MLKKQFFAKLRVRLLLLILFILLPALLLAGYTASEHRLQASINVQENALLLAQLASGTQEEVIDSTEQILIALSQLPILQMGDAEACTPLFVSLREQFPRYTNFYMIDTKGDTVCTGLPDAPPVNVFERVWFQRAMQVRKFSMADFEIGAVTKRPIVTLSYPVFDENGAIKYQIGAALDLRSVGDFIDTRLPPETVMIAVDRNGTILYRVPDDPNGEWIGRNESSNSLIQQALEKRAGTVESAGIDQVDRLYGFTALDVNNYSAFVMVGIPKSAAYASSNQLLVENLFGLGVIGAVALLAAWSGTANFVINPIHRLIRGANRLAEGSLEERVQLIRFENTAELGELTSTFNKMAEALEQRQKELTRSNHELEEARQGLEVKVTERTAELAVQITARQQAHQRLVFLAEAGALLASSLDYQVTLDRLVKLAVPRLAEWCHVDILQNEAVIRVAAEHIDPEKIKLLYELNRLFPATLQSKSGAGKVIATGQTEMVRELPDLDLHVYAQSPKHLELLNHFATRSYIIVPLTARGRTFGAMTFAFSSAVNRLYDETDQSLVEELAQRAALALDNARLYALEQGLRESAQHALARAEEADRLKLKFLAMISHELRTPLTSIKGFSTTLLAQDVEWDVESRDSFIKIISEEADKLTDLIEQLLDLSRIQAGTLRISPEVQPLTSVFHTAMAQLNILTKHHDLKVILPEDLPPVYVDFQRISQVIVNLVGNAVRYTSMGTQIIVAAAQRDNFIQVDVVDQGPGIPAEKRDLVFEAFRQADDKSRKGAGLGLAICRGLIEAHQGQIWIQDNKTPGTTISFTIPVAEVVFN